MAELVIATANTGKLAEYRSLLAATGIQLVSFETGAAETGDSYAENARIKAEAAVAARGLAALGDDSGIEVEALGGFPGLRSARLAPTQKERTAALLDRLDGHPRPWRARFVCVIALAAPGEHTRYFEGERWGEVVPEWRGTLGFGYDPVFFVHEAGRTFGEMDPKEKERWSHRGAAVRSLLESGALDRLGAARGYP